MARIRGRIKAHGPIFTPEQRERFDRLVERFEGALRAARVSEASRRASLAWARKRPLTAQRELSAESRRKDVARNMRPVSEAVEKAEVWEALRSTKFALIRQKGEGSATEDEDRRLREQKHDADMIDLRRRFDAGVQRWRRQKGLPRELTPLEKLGRGR